MAKTIDNRLSSLERQLEPEQPIGVSYDGGPVSVAGVDTGLTPEQFAERYPAALLIRVVYVDGLGAETARA